MQEGTVCTSHATTSDFNAVWQDLPGKTPELSEMERKLGFQEVGRAEFRCLVK